MYVSDYVSARECVCAHTALQHVQSLKWKKQRASETVSLSDLIKLPQPLLVLSLLSDNMIWTSVLRLLRKVILILTQLLHL